ncbi:MAG: aldo/keto reductase [Pseudomonadota bacterium]|jgi:aryl-alcohol dehydrogenase-like predicted oxidoreductase
MLLRRLGRSSLEVGPLAFGGNVFGWTADEATSFRLLDAAVAAGVTLIDTADVYSAWVPGHKGGESETVIGAWLKARGPAVRDKVVIATKVAMLPTRPGLSRDNIIKACEDSLQRLNTDVIDLYQAHRDDAGTPMAETLGAFGVLIKAGKVRVIGASNYTAERMLEAQRLSAAEGLPRYETLQPLYNLSDRSDFETDLQALCVQQGIGVIPYYGLASGFLTGKYRTEADFAKSVRGARMGQYLNDRGRRILAALDQVAAGHHATPAQAALAWLMAQPSVVAPIASATSLAQFEELVGAMRLTLSAGDLAQLAEASEL